MSDMEDALLEILTRLDAIDGRLDRLESRLGMGATGGESDTEILDVLRRDGMIHAIKLHRERTGQGLKESKEAVERLARQHGIELPRGCMSVLFLPGVLLFAARLLV